MGLIDHGGYKQIYMQFACLSMQLADIPLNILNNEYEMMG